MSLTIVTKYCGEENTREIQSRGKCTHCSRIVWSDQARYRNDDKTYTHVKCPCRVGGYIPHIQQMEKRLNKREEVWPPTKDITIIEDLNLE